MIPTTEITIRVVHRGWHEEEDRITVDERMFTDLPTSHALALAYKFIHEMVTIKRESGKGYHSRMGGHIYKETDVDGFNEFLRNIENSFERRREAGFEEIDNGN